MKLKVKIYQIINLFLSQKLLDNSIHKNKLIKKSIIKLVKYLHINYHNQKKLEKVFQKQKKFIYLILE